MKHQRLIKEENAARDHIKGGEDLDEMIQQAYKCKMKHYVNGEKDLKQTPDSSIRENNFCFHGKKILLKCNKGVPASVALAVLGAVTAKVLKFNLNVARNLIIWMQTTYFHIYFQRSFTRLISLLWCSGAPFWLKNRIQKLNQRVI